MTEIKLPEGFTTWSGGYEPPEDAAAADSVEVVFRGGMEGENSGGAMDWSHDGGLHDIVGYRVLDGVPHPHAALMAEFAKDALISRKPWTLWQTKVSRGNWVDLEVMPQWIHGFEYRRKPVQIPTQVINGFTVPKGETLPPQGEDAPYFTPAFYEDDLFRNYFWGDDSVDRRLLERGLVFLKEEHAVAVAKAMLGIDPEWSQE